jgi:hypothetical protein
MSNKGQLDKQYRSIAWGVLFILVGSLSLLPGDQTSLAILGAGTILLALNVLRSMSGIRPNGFSLALGAAGFLAGGLALMRAPLGLHFEVQLFPVILIAIGLYFLWPSGRGEESAHG